MPGGLVRLINKIGLIVSGSDLSSTNPIWTAFGLDVTGAGNITGSGQTVSTSCDGKNNVTIGVAGTWTATLQFEATQDGTNWIPIRATFAPSGGGAPSFCTSIASTGTNSGVASIGCSGYSQVRVRCSAFTSGTAAITMRAATATRMVTALMSALGSIGASIPDSALLSGVKDASGNLQALLLGQALQNASLPFTHPSNASLRAIDSADNGALWMGIDGVTVTNASTGALVIPAGTNRRVRGFELVNINTSAANVFNLFYHGVPSAMSSSVPSQSQLIGMVLVGASNSSGWRDRPGGYPIPNGLTILTTTSLSTYTAPPLPMIFAGIYGP